MARSINLGETRVIAAGEEQRALAPLPLHVLPMTPLQAETLDHWGIQTLNDLASLPPTGLIERMGQAARELQAMAQGVHGHLFQPAEPAWHLEEREEFDFPVEMLDSLLFVVRPMLEQLLLRANMRSLALAEVTIALQLEGGGEHLRTVRPAVPSSECSLLLKLLHLDLIAFPPVSGVLGIALRAHAGASSQIQLGLFSPQMPDALRLDVTLARIAAIVGETNVGSAVLRNTHNRHRVVKMGRFDVNAKMKSPPARNRLGALRRIVPSEQIGVDLCDGRPGSLYFRDQRWQVELCYGPWSSSGQWWSEDTWAEQQWDVIAHTESSVRQQTLYACVVRAGAQKEWRMEAIYD